MMISLVVIVLDRSQNERKGIKICEQALTLERKCNGDTERQLVSPIHELTEQVKNYAAKRA